MLCKAGHAKQEDWISLCQNKDMSNRWIRPPSAKRTWVEGARSSFSHQLWCQVASDNFTSFCYDCNPLLLSWSAGVKAPLPSKYLRKVWWTVPSNCNFQHCKRKQILSVICWRTSATSARDRDTKESREFPSSRLGPSKEVPLVFPTGVGNIFRPFSGEIKLATKKRHISKSLHWVFSIGRIKRRTRKFKMEISISSIF